MMRTICFATNNRNKLAEVEHLLLGRIKLISLQDIGHETDLAEDFFTLEDNAKQKADFIFKQYSISCFADDTGLEVDVLNSEPGVLSARYAGPQKSSSDNIKLLLNNLSGAANRKARFRTIIALKESADETVFFEGKVEGEIINELRGSGGFGYDPIFVPVGFNKTLAEMSMEEKNTISHRAVAVGKLVQYLLKKF